MGLPIKQIVSSVISFLTPLAVRAARVVAGDFARQHDPILTEQVPRPSDSTPMKGSPELIRMAERANALKINRDLFGHIVLPSGGSVDVFDEVETILRALRTTDFLDRIKSIRGSLAEGDLAELELQFVKLRNQLMRILSLPST